jgi:hypothetical protein
MLRHVALVRTDVSEELSAPFIRVTRIGELGTTLAVISNRSTLRRKFLREFVKINHCVIHMGNSLVYTCPCIICYSPPNLSSIYNTTYYGYMDYSLLYVNR